MEPISPTEKDKVNIGPRIEHSINLINEAITLRKWHDNFTDSEDKRKKYHAILLGPYDDVCNEILREKLVELYTAKGWDCMQSYCYSAHGPHYCFYINKNHFL